MGGGHNGPPYHESVCRFHRVRARLTKTHDFVPFHNWKVQEKPFFEFFFENFWKLNFENFRGSSSMTRKIEKIEKNQIFCRESYFYWLNLFCICSQLSFEVYSSSVAQNFKFQIFLAWKIRFLIFVVWRLIAPKLYYIGGCFWCLWIAKDQNIYLRACLWLLVAPELRKRGGAIMAPPHGTTSFQSPWDIGLSGCFELCKFPADIKLQNEK